MLPNGHHDLVGDSFHLQTDLIAMKRLQLLCVFFVLSSFCLAEELEPLTLDMGKRPISEIVLAIADAYKFDVSFPDSAYQKRVGIQVKKKNPIDVFKAIALSSGYTFEELNGIYVFGETLKECPCAKE